jgi:hypothetical protein
VPLWRAIDWQPLELSAVPIAADPAAGFRGHQALLPCRLIHRAAAAHHPETEAMDQPTAETRAADTPTLTSEETVKRENAEAAVMAADKNPTAAEQGEQLPPKNSERAADAAAAEDIARRVVTLDEARTVLIDDAAEHDKTIETRLDIRTGGIDECETRRWSPPSSTALIRIVIS